MTPKWRYTDGIFDFSTESVKDSLRSQLKNFLGSGLNIDAHHIIPLGVTNHPVIQAAALDGFHPNMLYSILGLEHYDANPKTGVHQNHPAYDQFIARSLSEFVQKNPDYNPHEANEFIQNSLIPIL